MTEESGFVNIITINFCGEIHEVTPDREFVIGREGDLEIDDNPYLHRRFLSLRFEGGLWWLSNDGSRISATVSSRGDGLQAWLPPNAKLPLVFGETAVVFAAGPTTYQVDISSSSPTFAGARPTLAPSGDSTIGDLPLTRSQRALIVALAAPLLLREGSQTSAIPSSAEAAARLGWSITKFNRKLDNVCEKFDRIGVAGLRGGSKGAATSRRARLVEYAMAARVVTADDLPVLDEELAESARPARKLEG